MEITYYQQKEEGRTVKQRIEIQENEETDVGMKRKKLEAMLSSLEGITLPITVEKEGVQETQEFVFNFDGDFDNENLDLNGGELIIALPDGKEVGSISYVLIKGKTSSELTAFISDKRYEEDEKELYENKGLMKIGFSLLAEVLIAHEIKKVEGYILGGMAAEKSRANALRLFGTGTYADTTKEVEIDSTTRVGEKEKVLVTDLMP